MSDCNTPDWVPTEMAPTDTTGMTVSPNATVHSSGIHWHRFWVGDEEWGYKCVRVRAVKD